MMIDNGGKMQQRNEAGVKPLAFLLRNHRRCNTCSGGPQIISCNITRRNNRYLDQESACLGVFVAQAWLCIPVVGKYSTTGVCLNHSNEWLCVISKRNRRRVMAACLRGWYNDSSFPVHAKVKRSWSSWECLYMCSMWTEHSEIKMKHTQQPLTSSTV